MKSAIKAQWLNLLRNNPEQQIAGHLGQRTTDGTTYFCATGILLDNIGAQFNCTPYWGSDNLFRTADGNASTLSDEFCNEIGLGIDDCDTITQLNDENCDFLLIADWIEENVAEDEVGE